MKPRCDGCGTPNAIDAIFCQECGIGLNIKNKEIHDIPGTLFDGMKPTTIKKCTHKTVVSNYLCQCVKCVDCDTRTETCSEHKPNFDYSTKTGLYSDSLDRLRKEFKSQSQQAFIKHKEKQLDFRSLQIPNWEFKDHQKEKRMEKLMKKIYEDPNYIPLLTTNKDIEIIPFPPIVGTDVRKDIPPQKPNLIPIVDDKIKKQRGINRGKSSYTTSLGFSKVEIQIMKFCLLAIIISLGILYSM